MSYKTDNLADLFPKIYAARESESILYKLLDTIAAEMLTADARIKDLLKSHWVEYAKGDALDRLAAIYRVTRRRLSNHTLETDEAFRQRLQSIVSMFVGGGTVQAVKGAVRSALGLPFDLTDLELPPDLENDIEKLVQIQEFSPQADVVLEDRRTVVGTRPARSQLTLKLTEGTATDSVPRIEWTFTRGSGRKLVVLRNEEPHRGFKSADAFSVRQGQTIVFTAGTGGKLSALVGGKEMADSFTNLTGTGPALMPTATTGSEWQFTAESGVFNASTFDNSTFDLPEFLVRFSRIIYRPLTFEVVVPFFLKAAISDLARQYSYTRDIMVFEGIPLEHIQEVVDQSRAAGVRGNVQFSFNFSELHDHTDQFDRNTGFRPELAGLFTESNVATDSFQAANANSYAETQVMDDRLILGGVFDVSQFDRQFGFQ